MKIIFDNVIFSLQKAGGISVVWSEILRRALVDPSISAFFLDEKNQNIFRKDLFISPEKVINSQVDQYPLQIRRYLTPKNIGLKGIFHSSYYRVMESDNAVNVTTVHDFTYEKYRKGFPKLVHQKQKKKAILHSEKIICVSENTKKDLLEFYPRIREEQVKVVYNGVNKSYFPLSSQNGLVIKSLVPFSSGNYVLYVGERKATYKNFDLVVKACEMAKIPLVMVGGGPLSKETDQYLSEKLGARNFEFFRGIDNEKLNHLYNHALCLLYPSLYEGFGIPIIEAQKAGCPVVCTNFSSIPEVAGKGAFYLDELSAEHVKETLFHIQKQTETTSGIVKEGIKNAARFSWDRCYEDTRKVYEEIYQTL